MEEDERLINVAHDLFNQHSIFEIIDVENRAEAIRTMLDLYGSDIDLAKVERCLAILDRIRALPEKRQGNGSC